MIRKSFSIFLCLCMLGLSLPQAAEAFTPIRDAGGIRGELPSEPVKGTPPKEACPVPKPIEIPIRAEVLGIEIGDLSPYNSLKDELNVLSTALYIGLTPMTSGLSLLAGAAAWYAETGDTQQIQQICSQYSQTAQDNVDKLNKAKDAWNNFAQDIKQKHADNLKAIDDAEKQVNDAIAKLNEELDRLRKEKSACDTANLRKPDEEKCDCSVFQAKINEANQQLTEFMNLKNHIANLRAEHRDALAKVTNEARQLFDNWIRSTGMGRLSGTSLVTNNFSVNDYREDPKPTNTFAESLYFEKYCSGGYNTIESEAHANNGVREALNSVNSTIQSLLMK